MERRARDRSSEGTSSSRWRSPCAQPGSYTSPSSLQRTRQLLANPVYVRRGHPRMKWKAEDALAEGVGYRSPLRGQLSVFTEPCEVVEGDGPGRDSDDVRDGEVLGQLALQTQAL